MFIKMMHRTTILVLLLLFTLGSAAYAATSSDLLDVLPGEPGNVLTRSEFGAMLVNAANLQPAEQSSQLPADVNSDVWYAKSVQTLLSANVLRGYADGIVKPDQPITQAEAVAFIARALGLPQGVLPRDTSNKLSIPGSHWAYTNYSWMVNEGLLTQVDAKKVLTPQEGADLLTHVFGTAEQCRAINEKMEKANQSITSMRMSGKMDMQMNMRQVGEAQNMPTSVKTTANMETELVMDKGLHMVMETSMAPGENLPQQSFTIEQYMTNEGMFMGMQDPATKQVTWTKIPSDVFPNIMSLMKQQANPVPEEIKNMFHYRYLGEEKLAGKEVVKLAYYGEIKDLAKMIAALGQLGGQLQQTLDQAQGLLQSITYAGTMYVDKATYLPLNATNESVVTFASAFQGQAMPIDTMLISYDFTYSDYNAPLSIVLPKEALNAEEVSLTAPDNADTKTEQPDTEQ